MRTKNLLISLLMADVVVFAIYRILIKVLSLNGLALRNVPTYIFYALISIITLIVIVVALHMLYQQVKKRENSKKRRLLSGIGMALLITLTLLSSFVLFIIGVFLHEPEHVIEKDGKTMVALVNSYLQVEVNYFDYENALVHSASRKRWEDYGNGGYDPFEREEMPKVKRYMAFDDSGKLIESN